MDIYISAIHFCQSWALEIGIRLWTAKVVQTAYVHRFPSPLILLRQIEHQSSLYPSPFPRCFSKQNVIYIYIYIQTLTSLHNLTLKMEIAYTSEMTATSPTSTWCNSPRIEFRTGFKRKHLVRSPQCLQKPEIVEILLRIWFYIITKS
jgi:hypothetical protein